VLAHKLQCKPIEGYDLPLGDLEKKNEMAQLLEIEDIEEI
jgi:hypothetical protein